MKRRTAVLWKRIILRFMLFILGATALYVYFFTGALTISKYEIIGAPEGYAEKLTTDISYASERKLYYLLPSNRIISYHDDDIRNAIMDTLPNTKDITIYPSGLHEISIKLTQHEPIFSVSETHAISSKGVTYKEIIPLDDFIRLDVSSSTKISHRKLFEMSDFAEKIGTVLFSVRHISIDGHGDIRFFDSDKGSSIIVKGNASSEEVWSNVLSAIDTDPLKGKLKDNLSNLSYIDTRFGNKVFYKFTNPEDEAIIPPHEESASSTEESVLQ